LEDFDFFYLEIVAACHIILGWVSIVSEPQRHFISMPWIAVATVIVIAVIVKLNIVSTSKSKYGVPTMNSIFLSAWYQFVLGLLCQLEYKGLLI
jgi:Na+/citrate or Na+/malate symporter